MPQGGLNSAGSFSVFAFAKTLQGAALASGMVGKSMTAGKLKGNFHTHTVFCDGENTAQEMVEEALARGFTHLGFSGHMDPDIRMDLAAYDAEIRRLQEAYRGRIDILRGVELDGLYVPRTRASEAKLACGAEGAGEESGSRTERAGAAESDSAERAGAAAESDSAERTGAAESDSAEGKETADERVLLDGMEYLIGSTHFIESPSGGPLGSVDDTWERLEAFCREEFSGDYYRLSKEYYRTEAEIFSRTHCTFVGHFDLVTRFNDERHFLEEDDPRYYMPALETMEYLVSQGLPLEINCGAFNRGRKAELYPNRFLLKNLREMGGEILISSDAHRRELLDGGFEAAVRTAADCGFTHMLFPEHGNGGSIALREVELDQADQGPVPGKG